MRLSIIGGGRVGQALGRLAFAAGYEIVDVVCQSASRAQSAVKFIGAGKPRTSAGSVLSEVGLTIIATPDDSIEAAVELLLRNRISARSQAVGRPARGPTHRVALHTSGARPSSVLMPLKQSGFSIGSCHPLQTFESPGSAVELISKSHFCIEGEQAATRAARTFVRKIGARFFEIDTGQKELYHAAAALASAGTVALLSISLELLGVCGLDQVAARKVLMPLVEGTVANVSALGPAAALTGPVRRRDLGTVKRNLAALRRINPEWEDLYKQLGWRGLSISETGSSKEREIAGLLRARSRSR